MKKPSSRFVLMSVVGLALASLVFLLARDEPDPNALFHHGIAGPSEATPLPETPPRTGPSAYAGEKQGRNALALWVRDSSSSWLGLVHGLKAQGVPVRVVTRLEEALAHRVVMAYPSLTGANTPPGERDELEAHVTGGGTLIAFSVVGGGLRDVFGYGESEEAVRLRAVRLSASGAGGWRPDEAESLVPLADFAEASEGLPAVRYRAPAREPLAAYDDGTPAIVGGAYGRGAAYAVGFDLGHYVLRAHNGRFNVPPEAYVNSHQPKIDGLFRLVAHWYARGEPDAVTLGAAPEGRDFAALITHDVDYTGSMNNVEAYAADEAARGLPATYFIQAKYVTDYNDEKFFDMARRDDLRRLVARGQEIASHTVAHSYVMRDMPMGTGREAYPGYRPFVKTFTSQRGGSLLGELRVSKYLLEALSGAAVTAFRPGHLSLPPALPEALAATGYRYSSSITAGQAMTHRPYRMMHGRSYDAETGVYEFPVTIEDERWKLGENIDSGIALARAVGRRGGLVNVMIHTDVLGGKLEFQRSFHAALKDEAWFGTLSAYGDWWAARDHVALAVETPEPGRKILTVSAPRAVKGLTLEVPAGWRLASGGATQSGSRVVPEAIGAGGRATLEFNAP